MLDGWALTQLYAECWAILSDESCSSWAVSCVFCVMSLSFSGWYQPIRHMSVMDNIVHASVLLFCTFYNCGCPYRAAWGWCVHCERLVCFSLRSCSFYFINSIYKQTSGFSNMDLTVVEIIFHPINNEMHVDRQWKANQIGCVNNREANSKWMITAEINV